MESLNPMTKDKIKVVVVHVNNSLESRLNTSDELSIINKRYRGQTNSKVKVNKIELQTQKNITQKTKKNTSYANHLNSREWKGMQPIKHHLFTFVDRSEKISAHQIKLINTTKELTKN